MALSDWIGRRRAAIARGTAAVRARAEAARARAARVPERAGDKRARTDRTDRADRAGAAPAVRGPSPNPATNLVIADVAMRSGGELLRMGVEAALLGRGFGGSRAARRKVAKAAEGRTLKQTLVGAALGRIATRSVPGAMIVGGGMLAKTLYDRAQDRRTVRARGEAELDAQAANAD